MLEWVTATNTPHFALLVHHTDADRDSAVGHLDKALDETSQKSWTVVNMKKDWKRIFPFEK